MRLRSVSFGSIGGASRGARRSGQPFAGHSCRAVHSWSFGRRRLRFARCWLAASAPKPLLLNRARRLCSSATDQHSARIAYLNVERPRRPSPVSGSFRQFLAVSGMRASCSATPAAPIHSRSDCSRSDRPQPRLAVVCSLSRSTSHRAHRFLSKLLHPIEPMPASRARIDVILIIATPPRREASAARGGQVTVLPGNSRAFAG